MSPDENKRLNAIGQAVSLQHDRILGLEEKPQAIDKHLQAIDKTVRVHRDQIWRLEDNYKIIVAGIRNRPKWSLPRIVIDSQVPGVIVGAGIMMFLIWYHGCSF